MTKLFTKRREPSSDDVWYNRNQPHGLWKGGNPIIKFLTLCIIIVGSLLGDTILILQGATLGILFIILPAIKGSKIINVLLNLGIGGIIIGLIPSFVRSYFILLPTYNLPISGELNIQMIVLFFFVAFSLIIFSTSLTARDIAFIMDMSPTDKQTPIGSVMYGYMYGIVRWPGVIKQINESIKSRGGNSLLSKHYKNDKSNFSEKLFLRLFNLHKVMDEMTTMVQFIIFSRIKIDIRDNISRKSWTSVDWSILSIQLCVIIAPFIIFRI